jgi:hypothetical protein
VKNKIVELVVCGMKIVIYHMEAEESKLKWYYHSQNTSNRKMDKSNCYEMLYPELSHYIPYNIQKPTHQFTEKAAKCA